MSLQKIRDFLTEREYEYDYIEEDGCDSIDFLDRGLKYHIWEYADDNGVPCGVETNIMHAGHMDEIEAEDYVEQLYDMIQIFDNRTGM